MTDNPEEQRADRAGTPLSDHSPVSEHVPTHRRGSVLWWAMICVPAVILLGLASGQLVGSGEADPWFAALNKPSIYPPGWLFGVVWTVLYAMMGFALALVFASDRKGAKRAAIAIFAVQLFVNLAWSPIFFGMHRIAFAFGWILLLIVLVLATIAYFMRVSRLSGLLLLPYLAWICFAAWLNLAFLQAN